MQHLKADKLALRLLTFGLVMAACLGQAVSVATAVKASRFSHGATHTARHGLVGLNVFGQSLQDPTKLASDGADVFVSTAIGSIVELTASTGATVRVFGPAYGWGDAVFAMSTNGRYLWVAADGKVPVVAVDLATGAIAPGVEPRATALPEGASCFVSDGDDLWVCGFDRVVEFSMSTGEVRKDLTASNYDFGDAAYQAASDGTHLWVLDADGKSETGSITELDLATGALVRVLAHLSQLDNPQSIGADPSHVWIANCASDCDADGAPSGNGSVTVLNVGTGAVYTSLSGSTYGIDAPVGVSDDGAHVWITNQSSNSVTELDAASVTLIQIKDSKTDSFDLPSGVDSDGNHVWVSNGLGNDVTELDASTGALVSIVRGEDDGLSAPDGILADGTHVWACNTFGRASITELDESTGGLVRILHLPVKSFLSCDIASSGPDLWVVYQGIDDLWEINSNTGRVVRIVNGAKQHFKYPVAVAADASRVWVSDGRRGIYEFSASTGVRLLTIRGAAHGLLGPWGLTVYGSKLWVGEADSHSVAEFNATTGAFIREIMGSKYAFVQPTVVATNGADVFVTGPTESWVTEFNVATGALIRVLRGSRYGLRSPHGITANSTRMWVADGESLQVTECSAKTGSLVQLRSGGQYDFYDPSAIAISDNRVWVANYGDDSVTEFPAT
jgi:hypothetical protein